MTPQCVKILLLGAGGYGHYYIEGIKRLQTNRQAELVAIVDPMATAAPDWPYLEAQAIPTFDSLNTFLGAGIAVDLAIVASPIPFHAEHSCQLLEAGINVLCEKPLAATTDEVERMRLARDASGKFIEIGYQWSFSEAIQRLKADILRGAYGKAQQLSTRVAWARSSVYYARNTWAGRIFNEQGAPVYDSPVNNATAHYLQNMIFLIGPAQHVCARPRRITAECYRANPIENYDTACLKIETEEGPTLYFYTSHAVESDDGPVFYYEFETAEIRYSLGGDIIAYKSDGSIKNYGDPGATHMRKLEVCVRNCLVEKDERTVTSSIEATWGHTYCVDALQRVPVQLVSEPHRLIKTIGPEETLTYIPSMLPQMQRAFDAKALFSELELPWAREVASMVIEISMPQSYG